MAVHIRMKRMGTNKRLQFRIVATDSRMPRDGRFLESFGHYDPTTEPAKIQIDDDRLAYWVKNGAQVSMAVKNLLKQLKKRKAGK
ncbi:MAG TPA: 30S ribosomal protein S16 [Candidatus Omnitrophota bacterium]|nr:30S ribosomal protein S16 [Candidatus Omnitrophota bacterium]